MIPVKDILRQVLVDVDELAAARVEARATVQRLRHLFERQMPETFNPQLSCEPYRLLAAEELLQ